MGEVIKLEIPQTYVEHVHRRINRLLWERSKAEAAADPVFDELRRQRAVRLAALLNNPTKVVE